MNAADLKAFCLTMLGARETFPFGNETSVFKVGGKLFALSALEGRPLSVNLKCDPDLAQSFRAAHPAITPGYHMNKKHWNTVILDGSLPDEMIEDMIRDSYDLVVATLPKLARADLDRDWE